MKIAVMFQRLGPYHVARLTAAARLAEVTSVEVQRTDREYGWDPIDNVEGFTRETLFESDQQRPDRARIRQRIDQVMQSIRPEVIAIHGWSERVALMAMQWANRHKVPMVVMSETNQHDAVRKRVGEWIKQQIVGNFSAALVGGQSHRDYLARLGLPADRCFLGYDVIDNDYFQQEAERTRQQEAKWREELDLPNPFLLASCRFISKKNLPRLLQAYREFCKRISDSGRNPWDLVLLGDGPQKSELMQLASDLGIADHVRFTGFQQYDRLPRYLGLAKALVHISTVEQWGLVINEAMAAGVPVVVSHTCGSALQLAQHRRNGLLVDPYDVPGIANTLVELFSDQELGKTLAQQAAESIADWGPDRFGTGLHAAATCALEHGVPKPPASSALTFRLLTRYRK